jgi:hypothetical protein
MSEKKFPKLPIELEPTEKPLESDSTLIAGLKVVYNDETLPKDEHNDQLVKNRKAMYRGELPPAKEEKADGKAGKEAEAAGGEAAASRANFVPPVNAEAGRAGAGDAVTGEESRRGGKLARNTETSEARSGVSPEA